MLEPIVHHNAYNPPKITLVTLVGSGLTTPQSLTQCDLVLFSMLIILLYQGYLDSYLHVPARDLPHIFLTENHGMSQPKWDDSRCPATLLVMRLPRNHIIDMEACFRCT